MHAVNEAVEQMQPPQDTTTQTQFLVRSDELNDEIVAAADAVLDLMQDRRELNAKIQAVIEGMEAKGIPRAAFKATIRKMDMSEDQRQAYDNAMLITCSAVGIPIQLDLFEN